MTRLAWSNLLLSFGPVAGKYEGTVLGLGIGCFGELSAGFNDVCTFIARNRAVSYVDLYDKSPKEDLGMSPRTRAKAQLFRCSDTHYSQSLPSSYLDQITFTDNPVLTLTAPIHPPRAVTHPTSRIFCDISSGIVVVRVRIHKDDESPHRE